MAENKVHSIRKTIQKAINYIIDDEKTEGGINIIARNVIPQVAETTWKYQMQLISQQSAHLKGEDASVQGYHFIQSFKGREVDEETALELTKKWIESFVPEGCWYVLACHNDQPNIHVHAIVSTCNMDEKKIWHLSYIKDLNRIKHLANEINKEAGLSIIKPIGKTLRSHYEWEMEKGGMSQKKYIRKCIDAAIPKVNSYHQLCDYLRCFGFEIEDGTGKYEEKTGDYTFSLNEKMIVASMETDEKYYFRIPYTSQYMFIDKKNCRKTSDGKTVFAQINLEERYETFSEAGKEFTRTGEEISKYLERKTYGRKGLRIRTPEGKKFFRERSLGKGYSVDDITERIEKDGQIFSDPEIEKLISSNVQEDDRSEFFRNAGVPRFEKSEWARMSRKERYYKYRTERIQKIFDEHYYATHDYSDVAYMEKMKNERAQLHKEIDEVNKELNKMEKELQKIYSKMFEMEMEVTQKDINDFVVRNITPLRNDKNYLKERIRELTKRISEAERKRKDLSHERNEMEKEKKEKDRTL